MGNSENKRNQNSRNRRKRKRREKKEISMKKNKIKRKKSVIRQKWRQTLGLGLGQIRYSSNFIISLQ